MDVGTLKNHIVKNTLQNLYVFTGDEWMVQKIYAQKMADISGRDLVYADTISDILNNLLNRAFLRQPTLYFIRDDKDIVSNEKLQNTLLGGLYEDIVIIAFTSLDKRTKFYKAVKDFTVEFEHLPEQTLIKYIQKEIGLSTLCCKHLISLCENDYGRILLEIDKMKAYNYGTHPFEIWNTVFSWLVDDGTIYEPPYDAVFDYVDAVLRRQVNKAYNLLQQSYDSGEATLVLLTNLYNGAKQVLQVQACESNDIAKSTGLTGWQIKHAKDRMNYYTIGELVYMLKLIRQVERGIKVGDIEDSIAMQYIMAHIF